MDLYWVSQHQHHHKHADTDEDINSPLKGFWHSFFYWRFKESATKKIHLKNYCTIRAAKDPVIVFLSTHFIKINLAVMLLLCAISVDLLVSCYLLPILIEQLRVNVLNSLAHMKLPGSYKIADSNDNSYNNVVLGFLTLGFGWHNAHHANPRELINTHRWWEIDVEGLIGKLISKKS
jgi:stearoyl-CoA desaturase (delta-9 desaturase)